jgi:hypothetical protein
MATWFWINIPLMVLAFALTTGLSYALLLGGRRETRTPGQAVPATAAALAPAAPAAPAAPGARTLSAHPAAA